MVSKPLQEDVVYGAWNREVSQGDTSKSQQKHKTACVYHMNENHCGQKGSVADQPDNQDDIICDVNGYAFRGVAPFVKPFFSPSFFQLYMGIYRSSDR